MKHTNIAKVLGWSETEDLQDGLHLQPEEAAALDTHLGTISTEQQNAADNALQLEAANTKIQETHWNH